jgi:hypothetical protein
VLSSLLSLMSRPYFVSRVRGVVVADVLTVSSQQLSEPYKTSSRASVYRLSWTDPRRVRED